MDEANYMSFLPIVSALLIIAGWFVIYGNAKKLSTRSETFAIVNRVSSTLESLAKEGVSYWSDTRPAEEYESKLFIGLCNSTINTIIDLDAVLQSRGFDGLEMNRLHDLQDALTLDCEYRAGSQLETSVVAREKLRAIHRIASNLNRDLLSNFGNTYRPSSI